MKRNRTGGAGLPPVVAVRSNQLIAPFATARELVRVAYDVEELRVLGGPEWVDRDHFEVTATTPGAPTEARAREMLATMLGDRFMLTAHHETREVYALSHGPV